jgi:hypothetical protein
MKEWTISCKISNKFKVNLVSMLCIFNAIHALRDKVPLRLLKLYFYIVDVAEWSKALDIRLQAIGAVVYQRCAFEFRRGKTKYGGGSY